MLIVKALLGQRKLNHLNCELVHDATCLDSRIHNGYNWLSHLPISLYSDLIVFVSWPYRQEASTKHLKMRIQSSQLRVVSKPKN